MEKINEAVKAAKKAKIWSGEKELTARAYKEYSKKFGGPSYWLITKNMGWIDFKRKYLDSDILTPKERQEKKIENNFCNLCLEKENCEIELENCQYWREWNENQRKSFG